MTCFGSQSIEEYSLFYHFSSLLVQLLKSTDVGRHNLLYLKEIGNGWFGKVRAACGCGCSYLTDTSVMLKVSIIIINVSNVLNASCQPTFCWCNWCSENILHSKKEPFLQAELHGVSWFTDMRCCCRTLICCTTHIKSNS